MGLLMFREPDAAETKPTIKTDPSASARSAIRRRQHVRHQNHPYSSRPRSSAGNQGLDRRTLLDIIRRDRENDAATLANTSANATRDARFEAQLASMEAQHRERSDRSRVEARLRVAQESESATEMADLARQEASTRRRLENGRALLRDALSYERPGHRLRHARESTLRYELSPPLTETDSDHAVQRLLALQNSTRSPPFGHSPPFQRVDDDGVDGPVSQIPEQSTGSTSLTPRFAPAYRFDESAEALHIENSGSSTPPHWLSGGPLSSGDVPVLPRSRHRNLYPSSYDYAPSPHINNMEGVDGLGDRRRSFSPEESTWETLLATITPDERLPSSVSSFDSATASASSLSSNSAVSSSTLLTDPSSNPETLNTVSHICDDPTDSECSDTDDDYVLGRHSRSIDSYNVNPPPRHARMLERDRDRDRDNFERLLRRSESDAELTQMHAILARMDHHMPVPDEWWAAAGLSRNISTGRLDRAERERL